MDMDDFQITGKEQTITTENASNFVIAFKISNEENELLFHRFLDEEVTNHNEIKEQLKLKNIDINDMLEFSIYEFVLLSYKMFGSHSKFNLASKSFQQKKLHIYYN
jgi:hypothetical protein